MEDSAASLSQTTRVYALEPRIRFRALFWAVLGVVAAGIVYPIYLVVSTHRAGDTLQRDQFCFVAIFLCASLYYLALTLAWVRSAKVVVSPEGIEHHTLGMTFYTPWSNVQAVREGRWEATLVLAQPAHSTYGKLFTYLPGDKVRRLTNRTIPLSNYGWSLSSQLREDIQQYAPHLVEEPP
ncbi:MAG: hypothetical protein M3R24_02100 [Chloroflexota bacterium]|nr:hypothetical protein [Chloroflexota bacterium]